MRSTDTGRTPAIVRAPALVIDGRGGQSRLDEVVVEAPLEIRVAGDTIATTMRTPGEDRFVALGFLYAEGIIRGLEDVGTVAHCGQPGDPRYGHSIEVTPAGGARLDLERIERSRRLGLTTSACGVCGRDGIDDLLGRIEPPAAELRVAAGLIVQAPSLLSARQRAFARTGGLHGAAAIDARGVVLAFAEDIGRHNAVDKVVGRLLTQGQLPHRRPGSGAVSAAAAPVLLAVSGRASFEMVQKAAVAGFACLVSVSAASSLAIETADATGITLAAFARDRRFTIYSHSARVAV